MSGDSPSWVYLDLQAGPIPHELHLPPEDGEDGPTTVAVVATAGAREQGWAARATLHLVREWTRAGARIFLMDLSLDAPELHGFLGHENREGVSDIILYGASIPRVSRAVDGGAFYLGTAGTAVADPAAVVTSPRWAGVLQGFREAGVTLVVYLPHEFSEGCALAEEAPVRVLLRGPWEGEVEGASAAFVPTAVAGPGLGRSGGKKRDAGVAPSDASPDLAGSVVVTPEDPEGPEGAVEGLGAVTEEAAHPPAPTQEPASPTDAGDPPDPSVAKPEEVPPPASAPPDTSVPVGSPRAVDGDAGPNRLRVLLLLLLLAVVGVLAADFLGLLDLSGVLELPWHSMGEAPFPPSPGSVREGLSLG